MTPTNKAVNSPFRQFRIKVFSDNLQEPLLCHRFLFVKSVEQDPHWPRLEFRIQCGMLPKRTSWLGTAHQVLANTQFVQFKDCGKFFFSARVVEKMFVIPSEKVPLMRFDTQKIWP
jgi:hypothetical protein